MYQNDFFTSLGVAIGIFYFIFVIGMIAICVLYVKYLVEVMTYIRPNNRLINVGDLLWIFVPVVGSIYGFIAYPRISDSISNEYRKLGLEPDGDFGRSISIVLQVCTVLSAIPVVNFIAIPTAFVLWLIYFIKMSNYRKVLMLQNKRGFSEGSMGEKSEDILD